MPKITLKGTITVPAEKMAEMPAMIAEHVRLTHAEPGNLVFEVTQDAADPHLYHVYEEFKDKAAFEVHQARGKASAWGSFSEGFPRDFKMTEE